MDKIGTNDKGGGGIIVKVAEDEGGMIVRDMLTLQLENIPKQVAPGKLYEPGPLAQALGIGPEGAGGGGNGGGEPHGQGQGQGPGHGQGFGH